MFDLPNYLSRALERKSRRIRYSLVKKYRVISSASVDDLWQTIANLADVSWHPLLWRTSLPQGLIAKPGLFYRAVTRLFPIPVRIFVERVRPGELLSLRVLGAWGIEEQATYQVEPSQEGNYVSYRVTLRGWLSPLIWSLIRPHAARVAACLAQAAEQATIHAVGHPPHSPERNCFDF